MLWKGDAVEEKQNNGVNIHKQWWVNNKRANTSRKSFIKVICKLNCRNHTRVGINAYPHVIAELSISTIMNQYLNVASYWWENNNDAMKHKQFLKTRGHRLKKNKLYNIKWKVCWSTTTNRSKQTSNKSN